MADLGAPRPAAGNTPGWPAPDFVQNHGNDENFEMLIRPFKNAVGTKWMPSLESTIQTPKILTVPRMGSDSCRQNSHLKSSRMQPRSGFCGPSDLLIVGDPGPPWPVYSRESGSLPPSPVCTSTTYRPGPLGEPRATRGAEFRYLANFQHCPGVKGGPSRTRFPGQKWTPILARFRHPFGVPFRAKT